MKKIIIIEDDNDLLDLVEIVLRENGYLVNKSSKMISVAEIIALNPNLVIIDVRLVVGLGTDLCLAIKNNPNAKHIPVVLYSSINNLKALACNSLADGYLEKPFDLEDLLAVVEQTIA